MSKAYLLIKDRELKHTYSRNVATKLESEGYIYIGCVWGHNLSFSNYVEGELNVE
jgi:hypothetical protein